MRLAMGLCGLLMLCILATVEAAVQVQVEGGHLTLSAENAPLQDVLKAVADAGHFSLRLDAALTNPITVQFDRQLLLGALDSLLRAGPIPRKPKGGETAGSVSG